MSKRRGFTLVEIIVSLGVFSLIVLSVWQSYQFITELIAASRLKTTAIALANEQLEIVRNLSYIDVGTVGGVPPGKLLSTDNIVRGGITFAVDFTVLNIDDPYDGTFGGNPNDTSPADYKSVEIKISCSDCHNFVPFSITTTATPKNLETASNNGALFIKVINANGQPVYEANIHIVNNQLSPPINTTYSSDINGWLQLVDVPPAIDSYEITVSKDGYSTEKTYPPGDPINPNPIKPNATVVAQQVTQITFMIDKVSTIIAKTVNGVCAPTGYVNFHLQGAKLIGTNPNVYKYTQDHATESNGQKDITNLEWDNYTATLTDLDYLLAGSVPLSPFDLAPDSTLNLYLIVRQVMPKAILVKVRDASTKLPLSGATVRMQKPGWDQSLLTGRGYLNQTSWQGGSGQENFIDETKYWLQDGNIEASSSSGEIKLVKSGNNYRPSGWLISSTLDTGAASNFYNINWQPQDQPAQTEAKFQIATSEINPPTSWDFLGPDGTSNTYYTLANTNISEVHNGDRYLRYKVYLSTQNLTVTPNISDISLIFSSTCIPPGQSFFYNLPAAVNWILTVSKSGYQTYTETINIDQDWQERLIDLYPQ